MKKGLKIAGCALLWLATAVAGAAEGLLVRGWTVGLRYLEQFGRAENPYVAEDVSTVGVLAVFQLFLLLALLFSAVFCTYQLRQRRKTDEYETTDAP